MNREGRHDASGGNTMRTGDVGENSELSLSELEKRVLKLTAAGLTSSEVDKELHYSKKYIEHILGNVRERLRAKNTTHAIVLVLELGFM
jgi:DNA-binding CsgD family transcriptional regulator